MLSKEWLHCKEDGDEDRYQYNYVVSLVLHFKSVQLSCSRLIQVTYD